MTYIFKTHTIFLGLILTACVVSEAARCRRKAIKQGTNAQAMWWKDIPGSIDVVKLDPSNFDENLTGRRALVLFFAQWCGHSKRARTAFAAVAAKMKREQSSILVGAVDCDESNKICERFQEIDGYPTLMYIKYRQPSGTFDDVITQQSLYQWFMSKLQLR